MSAVESVMKIGALAPWYGSKRTLAPEIIQEIGDHKAYWEPLCASMAVLLAKPESRMETVNDLHGDLINMALCIQDAKLGPAFYRRARRFFTGDDVLADAESVVRARDVEQMPDIDRALCFFISSWQGRNGEVGLKKNERGRTVAVRWTCNGGDPATRYASAVASIPAWRRRLRNVTVLRRDAFEVISRIADDATTAIYVDPPYLNKSDEYLHDFQDGFMGQANDHERLAEALGRFKRARIVVSYYDAPALAAMYTGWTVRKVYMNKAMSQIGGRESVKKLAPEVLLINGPSFAEVV